MNDMINFGIDLGTTNSLIAKFANGQVEVYKNPAGHRETLPSVVGFRKERILIGEKAREYIAKDPGNVFSGFKRKMGTDENFFVPALTEFRSPVELSSMVLKELKNFVYTQEQVDAAVITIPASFDTIQSNATKEAGYLAGFKEVVLLQEPIAASLAFANKASEELSGQWLVYDLGGGTYDVALVKFDENELRVVDHEGDNYLGGLDFDNLIIEKIIVPKLEATGMFPNIGQELRSGNSRYSRLYFILQHKAEEAKIELSGREQTDIEFEIEDAAGDEHDMTVTITRAAFEACIAPQIEYSLSLMEKLVQKNRLASGDIKEVILIGGSTYIPLVRNMIRERLGITVNSSVDPTTAVAAGAAFFAGTRRRQAQVAPVQQAAASNLTCRMAYSKTSRDAEEYFTAGFTGVEPGMQYRIQRGDGGYDTGLKQLAERVSEMLPLLPNVNNIFRLIVSDEKGNIISAGIPQIEINHGKFSIGGQPLPGDICIEVDDPVNKTTRLEVIFEKNNILPLRKTIVREAGKMVRKDSNESIVINVLEGTRYAMPSSNLPIGIIEIKGSLLQQDLVKGSDIEIMLEMNESRDLKVAVTLMMNDQEFANVFTPSARQVSIERLRGELKDLVYAARVQRNSAESGENYELAARAQMILEDAERCYNRVMLLQPDDVTDEKYQLEERKRSLARQLDNMMRETGIQELIDEYLETKKYTEELFRDNDDNARLEKLNRITANEQHYLAGQGLYAIRSKINEIRRLSWEIRREQPETMIRIYYFYNMQPKEKFTDYQAAREYLDLCDKAIERQNYKELSVLIGHVIDYHIDDSEKEQFHGTGLH